MKKYDEIKKELLNSPRTWLITGVAGFIGSNLLEALLKLNQKVIGLDNFATGYQHNLDEVKGIVDSTQWENFKFIQGDICNYDNCKLAIKGVDYVLHQAALGSVPRSIADPILSNEVNISGFLNMLTAAKEESVCSFTYAASSATYGDHDALPKIEDNIGKPLSPYAVTKYVNEVYSDVYSRVYGLNSIGLRYFNVFGRRQDPNGAYAAVIPKWISALLSNRDIYINGDGNTSRDFCYIENVVQMNILAATKDDLRNSEVYNVAVGDRTSLTELFNLLKQEVQQNNYNYNKSPIYKEFRPGDVMHSQACINKAVKQLGYHPNFRISDGIKESLTWYINDYEKNKSN